MRARQPASSRRAPPSSGAHVVAAQVGDREPERAQHAAGARHEHACACPSSSASAHACSAAGAAERDEREARAGRGRARRRSPAARGTISALATRTTPSAVSSASSPSSRAQALERRLGRARASSVSSPPSSAPSAEVAEEQVGVGHRRLLAAAAVGGRARVGARRARPDAQRAARVGPRDRAAAGADGVDVDHRQLDRHAGDHGLGRGAAPRRRATGATSVLVPPMSKVSTSSKPLARATCAAPTTPPAGPGEHAAGGAARPRRSTIDHAARGLHDQRRAAAPASPRARGQPLR